VKESGKLLGSLTTSLRLIPDQFSEPFAANPDAVIELAANGSVITMTPTGGETGVRNSSLSIQLLLAHGARLGWRRLQSWQSRSPSIKKPRRMAGLLY